MAGVAVHELRSIKRDPSGYILLLLMPLVLMAILKRLYVAPLAASGVDRPTGAEQAVPGLTVMFGFFLVAMVGLSVARDRFWRTWERMRLGEASRLQLLVARAVPFFLVGVVQQLFLIGIGQPLLGLRVRGSILALLPMAIAWGAVLVSIGCLVAAAARTMQQVAAFTNVGAVMFGAIGGALVPLRYLPSWVQPIAPLTPTYWAMRGYNAVVAQGKGFDGIALSVLVLAAIGVGFLALAWAAYNNELD